MVAHIARTCFPELYAKRLKEIEGDRDSFNAELPIFYCKSVVLFVFYQVPPSTSFASR